MNYKFNIAKDSPIAVTIGKIATHRFNNAKGDRDNQIWIGHVLDYFCGKVSIQKGQAVHMIRTYDFGAIKRAHMIAAMKLPHEIAALDDRGALTKILNPVRQQLLGYTEMADSDHADFVKGHLHVACTISHPKDKPFRGESRSDMIPNKVITRERRHFDETTEAHYRRALRALRIFNGEATENDLKWASEQLLNKTTEWARDQLKNVPA